MGMDLDGKTLLEAFDNAKQYELKDEDLVDSKPSSADNENTRLYLKVDLKNPKAVVIGLNPSKAKAGEINGDKTIRILSRALYGLGFGEFTMLNLYTIREPNSAKLIKKIKEYRESGKLEDYLTNFDDFKDTLDEADAILVVVGKSYLGDDPRDENFTGPQNAHKEAIENMIEALEDHKNKTWGVKRINDLDGSTITWNVHPSARSIIWTNDHEKKIIERFPVDVYLDKMGLGKQKRKPTTMETSGQSYEPSSH